MLCIRIPILYGLTHATEKRAHTSVSLNRMST